MPDANSPLLIIIWPPGSGRRNQQERIIFSKVVQYPGRVFSENDLEDERTTER